MGISPDYVLDKMKIYEVQSLLKYSYYKNKQQWEQARLVSYITAQVNSTKQLDKDNFLKFYWENDSIEDNSGEITQEEHYRIIEELKKVEKEMNNKQ